MNLTDSICNKKSPACHHQFGQRQSFSFRRVISNVLSNSKLGSHALVRLPTIPHSICTGTIPFLECLKVSDVMEFCNGVKKLVQVNGQLKKLNFRQM